MNQFTSITLCTLFFIACASAPKVKQEDIKVAIPENWTTSVSTTTQVDTIWWSHFNDAELDSLIAMALQNNFNLKAAAGRIHAAIAQAKIIGAPLWPQANFSLNGSRRKQIFVGLPIPTAGAVGSSGNAADAIPSSTSNSFGTSLDMSWEIDLWGRLRADKAAALADAKAAVADYHAAQLSLTAQIAKVWFAAIEAQRQVELAEATVENFEKSTDQVQSRYERGLRPSLDLRLSLSNLSSAKNIFQLRQQQRDNVLRQLDVLLGRFPSASFEIKHKLPALPGPVPAGLPAELIARRPDLLAAERRLAASGARVKQAKAALYPRLSLTSSGGTLSDDIKNLLNGDLFVWSIAGNLLQPIFQGGRLRAGVKLAQAQKEQAIATYAQNMLNAFSEVEAALAAENYLTAREQALKIATEQAIAARDLAQDRYDHGLSDFITVLEAQRRAFDAESQLQTIRRERLDARVDLHLALGGDFGMEEKSEH